MAGRSKIQKWRDQQRARGLIQKTVWVPSERGDELAALAKKLTDDPAADFPAATRTELQSAQERARRAEAQAEAARAAADRAGKAVIDALTGPERRLDHALARLDEQTKAIANSESKIQQTIEAARAAADRAGEAVLDALTGPERRLDHALARLDEQTKAIGKAAANSESKIQQTIEPVAGQLIDQTYAVTQRGRRSALSLTAMLVFGAAVGAVGWRVLAPPQIIERKVLVPGPERVIEKTVPGPPRFMMNQRACEEAGYHWIMREDLLACVTAKNQ